MQSSADLGRMQKPDYNAHFSKHKDAARKFSKAIAPVIEHITRKLFRLAVSLRFTHPFK